MAKTLMKLSIAIAVCAGAMCLDVPASRAFGDAPWCAMISLGGGGIWWDCEYRTFEACGANADHAFCNLNPSPGPSMAAAAAPPEHRKRHTQRH
jgi:hypothetical protein